MGFSYELKHRDGGDAGTFETNLSDWDVGDTFRADGNRHLRITAIIPAELVAEFIEGPTGGSRFRPVCTSRRTPAPSSAWWMSASELDAAPASPRQDAARPALPEAHRVGRGCAALLRRSSPELLSG